MQSDLTGNNKRNFFSIIVLVVVLAGAVGSVAMTFHAGHNNKSLLLPLLFVAWVLSPFVALVMANLASGQWKITARKAFYVLALFITFGSLFAYNGMFSPAGTKNAFVFLAVPFLSWALIVIAFIIFRFKK